MAIRIGKTIDLRDLNAVQRSEALFRELGEMFAGERGIAAVKAADALRTAMLVFEMATPVEDEEDDTAADLLRERGEV